MAHNTIFHSINNLSPYPTPSPADSSSHPSIHKTMKPSVLSIPMSTTPSNASPSASTCSPSPSSTISSISPSISTASISSSSSISPIKLGMRRSKEKAKQTIVQYIKSEKSQDIVSDEDSSSTSDSDNDDSNQDSDSEEEHDTHSIASEAQSTTSTTSLISPSLSSTNGHICELCQTVTQVRYGSGRFCGPTCARKYSIITRYKSNKTSHAEYSTQCKSKKYKYVKNTNNTNANKKKKSKRHKIKSTKKQSTTSKRIQLNEQSQSDKRWSKILQNRSTEAASPTPSVTATDMNDDEEENIPTTIPTFPSTTPSPSPESDSTISIAAPIPLPPSSLQQSITNYRPPLHPSQFRANIPKFIEIVPSKKGIQNYMPVPTPPPSTTNNVSLSYPVYPFSPVTKEPVAVPSHTSMYSIKFDMNLNNIYTPPCLAPIYDNFQGTDRTSTGTPIPSLDNDSQCSISESEPEWHSTTEVEWKCSYYPSTTQGINPSTLAIGVPHMVKTLSYVTSLEELDDTLPGMILKLENRNSSHSKSIHNAMMENVNFQNLFS